MVAQATGPKIMHPGEVKEIVGAEGSLIIALVRSGAVEPEVRAFNRTAHLWSTDGLTGIATYCHLRTLNVESSLAQQAAGLAQKMARDFPGMTQSGRIIMLLLPDGTIKSGLTQGEARESLVSLADVDLGRAVVVNVLHLHLEMVKRAKEYFQAREKAAAKR